MYHLSKITKTFLIYASILFISYCLSYLLALFAPDFPAPAPLIGLILLFLSLQLGWVKLESVDGLASNLMALTGFLFVPSGISIINSIDVLEQDGIKLLLVVFIATIVMLVSVAYAAKLLFLHHQDELNAEINKE